MEPSKLKQIMENVFHECLNLRESGQNEYALPNNCFSNFEKLSSELLIPREKILWVFAKKHIDGIASYLRGHTSQREDVRGRIKDLIVYLILLYGMIEEKQTLVDNYLEKQNER